MNIKMITTCPVCDSEAVLLTYPLNTGVNVYAVVCTNGADVIPSCSKEVAIRAWNERT